MPDETKQSENPKTILYVGGFELPDKNAAAQRVIPIAKAIRELGSKVVFLNYAGSAFQKQWKEYYGFQCFECPQQGIYSHLTDIRDVEEIVNSQRITHIIAYNYPSIALVKLQRLCKKKGIQVIADVTEWYVAQGSLLFRIIKTFDTEYRMRYLHIKCDAVIAISEYLYQFYMNKVRTVKIPAIVDIKEIKRKNYNYSSKEKTVFVYAGSPGGSQKERIDFIIDAIEQVKKIKNVSFHVIGMSKEEYEKCYQREYHGEATEFYGQLPHRAVVEHIINADWTIVIRDKNKVVQAGFPTKIAESIACGTPVLANRFSNICEYLDETNSILCEIDEIEYAIERACALRLTIDRSLFDYHRFKNILREVLR